MTPAEAYKYWVQQNQLTINPARASIVGYSVTSYGITILLENKTGITGIPYPYKSTEAILTTN